MLRVSVVRFCRAILLSALGANYVLPTASDYRAAGYLHADRKRMIDEDMAHFARLGWDAVIAPGGHGVEVEWVTLEFSR